MMWPPYKLIRWGQKKPSFEAALFPHPISELEFTSVKWGVRQISIPLGRCQRAEASEEEGCWQRLQLPFRDVVRLLKREDEDEEEEDPFI